MEKIKFERKKFKCVPSRGHEVKVQAHTSWRTKTNSSSATLKLVHYTYILHSDKDNKLYIGSTSNLNRRYKEHTDGKVFATKGRLPLRLISYKAFIETKDAIRREKYFKPNPGK